MRKSAFVVTDISFIRFVLAQTRVLRCLVCSVVIMVCFPVSLSFGQVSSAAIEGKVTDIKGLPLPGISVFLEHTSKGAATESEAEKLKETGFAISVIEGRFQKNLTTDINHTLKRTPGVNLREAGGLGSGFKLSLNGLSGNQIRYFIDGMPMENFGSSLSLNNYPAKLIDNIEIYKGVVPVSLGADALGGAVNIVTGYRKISFLDVAESYSSFNTHHGSLKGQYVDTPREFFIKGSSFFNYRVDILQ